MKRISKVLYAFKEDLKKKEFSKIRTSEKVLRSMWPWPLEGLIIDSCLSSTLQLSFAPTFDPFGCATYELTAPEKSSASKISLFLMRRLEISNNSLGGPGGPNQLLNSQIDVVWRVLQFCFTSFFKLLGFICVCIYAHNFPLRVIKNFFPLRVNKYNNE